MKYISKNSLIVLILSIIFYRCNNNNTAQKYPIKNDVFEYIANDSSSLFDYNFKSKRVFENDSVFSDYGILCSSDTSNSCSMKFYIKNGDWYLKNENVWELFYSKNGILSKIKLLKLNKTIIPKRNIKIGNEILYSFTCKEEGDLVFSTDHNEYLFSPNYGIVIIKNESTFYKRNDFIKK